MNLLRHSLAPLCPACCAMLLVALVSADPSGLVTEAGAAAKGQAPLVTASKENVEIRFPTPRRYALVLYETKKIRHLYTSGDVVFHPRDPTRSVTIERVDGDALVLRADRNGRERLVRQGQPIPGFPTVTFAGTVLLDRLQYRLKVVDHITQADPVLVSFTDSHAVLEKQVLELPPELLPRAAKRQAPRMRRRTLDPELLANIRVKEVDPNTYVLDEATVAPLIENMGQLLSDINAKMTPAFSMQSGVSIHLKSDVGDAVLRDSGFTVTRAKVAQTFGIEVGDTIISLNGRPVNSPVNAWWTFQEIFVKNRRLTNLRVNMIRGGKPMTKTFRIR